MIPLYTEEEFKDANSRDKLPLSCRNCQKVFFLEKHYIRVYLKDGSHNFCCRDCQTSFRNPMVEVQCFTCGKSFQKNKLDSDKKERHFCCRSCANKYSSTVNKENKTINQRKWARSEEGQKTLSRIGKIGNLKRHKGITRKIKNVCPVCGCDFHSFVSHRRIYCSKECRIKDSDQNFVRNKKGGYRKGCGFGKSGWYHGINCDSTWELAWIIYNEDHGIPFSKEVEPLLYSYGGKDHRYYPDFKMSDGTLIEIKGRKSREDCDEQTQSKMSSHPEVRVLYKDDLMPMISYVKGKYGCDFKRLYEGNPHNQRLNQCEICGKPAIKRFCSGKCAGLGRWKTNSSRGFY